MSETWPEDVNFLGEASSDWEGIYDPDSVDGEGDEESAASDRRRRERARQLDLARRRRWALRGQVPQPTRPAPPSTTALVRRIDLETKVQADVARSGFAGMDRRMTRAEFAAVAGVVSTQLQNSFGDIFKEPLAKAALSFAPLLLLAPRRRGTGFEAFISDPRVIGGALVAGIFVVGQRRNQGVGVEAVRITGTAELTTGANIRFVADVLDRQGALVGGSAIRWSSTNESVARVDASTGDISALGVGTTFISAESDGHVDRVALQVTDGGGAARGGGSARG
jgi:hypothetical protein